MVFLWTIIENIRNTAISKKTKRNSKNIAYFKDRHLAKITENKMVDKYLLTLVINAGIIFKREIPRNCFQDLVEVA